MTQRHMLLSGLVFSALTLAGVTGKWHPATETTAPRSVESATEITHSAPPVAEVLSVPEEPAASPVKIASVSPLPFVGPMVEAAQGQTAADCSLYNISFGTDQDPRPGASIFIPTGAEVFFRPIVTRVSDGSPVEVRFAVWVFPDETGEVVANPGDGEVEAPEDAPTPVNVVTPSYPHTYQNTGTFGVGLRVFIVDGNNQGWCPAPQNVGDPTLFEGAVTVLESSNNNSASFTVEDAVLDGTAVLPNNDWLPLAYINLAYPSNSPAPRALSRLSFTLVSDGGDLRQSDIQEFGIFRDRGGDNGAPNGVFEALNFPLNTSISARPTLDPPFPFITFDAKGNETTDGNVPGFNNPIGAVETSADKTDLSYEFTLVDQTDPLNTSYLTAGPEEGRGYFLAVRTSSAWSSLDDMGIIVTFAQMQPILPAGVDLQGNPVAPRFGLPNPDDNYSPDFYTGEILNAETRYVTSSLEVVDFRSPMQPSLRRNQWNWPVFTYTPVAEFNRFRFNATGFFLQTVLGEQLDIRDLLSYESWQPLLAMNLHGNPAGIFNSQPSEVNLVLTDIGADPYGPPGNGGFDPRNGRLDSFTSEVIFIGSDGNLAAGEDHTFNGIGIFMDANNNGDFDPPTPRDGFGVSLNGTDIPLYILDPNDNDLVTAGLLEWEYVPFPPGGGDPWWRIKIPLGNGARPARPSFSNVNANMEPVIDFYADNSERPDYFITIRPDSGYRDISGTVGDGTALAFGADMRAFIEPRRWNPQDGGHWDGGVLTSNQFLGRERTVVNGVYRVFQMPYWQDDPRHDLICESDDNPCPRNPGEGDDIFDYFTARTHNQTTVKPVKLGIDVHDLVLTYSTNNEFGKVTTFRELQGPVEFVLFQDPPVIFNSTLDQTWGNGRTNPFDLYGMLQLRFFDWNTPTIIGDILVAPDDAMISEHFAFETVPFRLDATAINPQLREPRSVYFTEPPQQPTLPDITNWPGIEEAVAYGSQSYCYLQSEGDIPNEPFLPASSDQSEASYRDDVYVFVAEDCSNCAAVEPGMWLVDRYGARFLITAVSGNEFTLKDGHAAYLDRQLRNGGVLNLDSYPFGIPVGTAGAVSRGRWMVVNFTLQRGQYARQQDWPAGLEQFGGARAARLLKQKVEINSQPTAMLGINLTGVNDPRVNEAENISLNSITVAFWGPEFDRGDLAPLDPNGTLISSGVLLYEDTNQNGVFDGPIINPFTGTVLVTGDTVVPLEAGSLQWRGSGPEPIDLDGDFLPDDLSGDGVIVLSQADREAQADNPDYDGLLDTAWVLRLEPLSKWIIPYTEPTTSNVPDGLKSVLDYPSFYTEGPTAVDLASFAVEMNKALTPGNANPGDDLFVVVRTSENISAFEQFRALIPSKLPSRTPASEQVAGVEMAPITYPVVQAFTKLDPEEGAVQSYYGHDMLEASVPARIVDLTPSLVPSPQIPFPVIEPGSAPVAALGIDVSANRPENLIGAGSNGSQISNGFTTASFTRTPTTRFYNSGWTNEVVGCYLIAQSDTTNPLDSRIEAYEITGVSNNDLTLRNGQPRVGSQWFVVKDPTFLEQVIVEFEDVQRDGDFDPQRDLLPLDHEDPVNGRYSGVSIYRDNDMHPSNRNGVFDPPVRDANGNIIEYIDLPVRLDDVPTFIGVPGEPEYQIRMVFSTPGTDNLRGRTTIAYESQPRNRQWIPQTFGLGSTDQNTGPDFFVVLRTSREMSEGDDFRVSIVSWGSNTPTLPDPDNFTPSIVSSQTPGQRPDEFDIFDEFPWGNRGLGFITFFRDPPPVYYWGYDHANRRERAVQEVDHSQDDKDIRYWVRSHPAVSGTTNVITSLPAPKIDFTADRHRQVPGGPVTFTLLTESTVSSVLWNFGDGTTSTQRNPTHIYENEGVYDVSVTVTNAFGVSDTVTKDDYIEIINAPFADFIASPTDGAITPDPEGVLPPGLDVTFVDRSRNSADLVAVRYVWDFGDGETLTTTTPATDANPIVHRYTREGFYTVTLEVTFRNPVTQATVVSVARYVALITVRPCVGCPGSGEGEGEGEGEGDGDVPEASLEITNLIRDKEALVPLHDWVPLANIVMGYGEDEFAPRILRTLAFELRPDTRGAEEFGIANINGPQRSDILEFGIFQETWDPGEENPKNNLLDARYDYLLYTFNNAGAPIGTSTETGLSILYRLNFVGNGTAAQPQFRLEAGAENPDQFPGNSYILAVRTSATWRSQTTLAMDVLDAQMIDPRNGRFPVNDEGEPIDSYSPNFPEGDILEEDLAYSASFGVFDITGNQLENVQAGGSATLPAPTNFWNHPTFLYTPMQEFARPLWDTPGRLFDLVAGEVLEMRTLISAEQWVPVLGINLHSTQAVHTSSSGRDPWWTDHAQIKEINLVFTDIGGDPLGPPGNGGFNPREMLDKNTDSVWNIYEPAFAADHTFNGAWLWHDTNNNSRFDTAVPNPTINGVTFPGDKPMYPNYGTQSAWEYIPFPPGGGDPWWKITLRTAYGERRPDEDEENYEGFLTAVPDNIGGTANPGVSEITYDYFVTVRADSGYQDVSLAPGDLNGIAAGADFRVFVEPRRFDGTTGSQTGGIYVDSMIPAEGITTNGATIFSTWHDDPRWLPEEPWWPERTHNSKSVKPLRAALDVHDLVMTYQSDSEYRNETYLFFGNGPFWDAGCLTYALPLGASTDFDAWTDPFALQQGKFFNEHSVGVLRFRFFGAFTFDFGGPIGQFSMAFDETNSSGQFAYETVPFFSNSLTNGDLPPAGPRSTAYPTPPTQPAIPDYSTWPAVQRPNEFQRASDWSAEDNRARLLVQQIEAGSINTPVLGINVASANDPVVNAASGSTIGKITVAFWGPQFSPSDLAPLDPTGRQTTSGVLLWEDADGDGVFTDAEVFRQFAEGLPPTLNFDRIVPVQNLRWPSAPELVDLNGDGTPDDMDGNGVVDDRDRAWVLDLTPANLWTVPRQDDPVGGFGTFFDFYYCGSLDFDKDLVVPPLKQLAVEKNHVTVASNGEVKQLDPALPQPGDDLFITIRTSETVERFERIRAVIPATLPQRQEGQRQAGIQFFPQFNTSATAFIKSNPDEDPVQDFYGHDTLQVGVPARLIDLTNQNSGLVPGGAAIAPFGVDLSTNQGRAQGTVDSGTAGVPDEATFQVPGRQWEANAFARDFLIDANYESFEILSNTNNTLQLRAGTPVDGPWRIVRNPTFLETVIVEFYNEGADAQFNLSNDLLPLKLDQELSGVAIYRDNDNDVRNRNGIFDINVDIPIRLDVAPRIIGNTGEATQVQFTFSTPGTDDVPQPRANQTRNRQWIYDTFGTATSDPEFGPDFFIVLRASDRMSVGDNFRIGIVGHGPITPTEPDPDTFAAIQSDTRNDAPKFREFPWAKRALGFISYSREPLVEYYMDSWRAGQKVDNSGFDWIRTHSTRKKRTGVLTATARTISPRSVVIEGASQTQLPSATLEGQPFRLVLNGRGFGTSPNVAISGYEVTVGAVTDTSIQLSLEVADGVPTEPIVVIVRNPQTGEEASRSDLFTLVPGTGGAAPDITGVDPSRGNADSFPVNILGTNLPSLENAFVAFGQTRMPVLSTSASGTSITVGFPAGGLPATGPLNVLVRNTATGKEDILLNGFNYEHNIAPKKGGLFGCGVNENKGDGGFWGDIALVAAVALSLLAASRLRRYRAN